MVLPIGEPEADAIAVASEECERREPVCQPPWKLTQLSSASTLRAPAGDEPAVARCRRSAAGALCTASTTENLFRVLERNGTPPSSPTSGALRRGCDWQELRRKPLSPHCVLTHMNGPIVNRSAQHLRLPFPYHPSSPFYSLPRPSVQWRVERPAVSVAAT